MEPKEEIGVLITQALDEGKTPQAIVELLSPHIEMGVVTKPEILVYVKIWQQSRNLLPTSTFSVQRGWISVGERIFKRTEHVARFARIKHVAVGAAATAIVVLGIGLLFNWFVFEGNSMNVSTMLGHQAGTTLPDGSQVKLNAGSSITYRTNRLTGTREIDFSGEGFFEVAKNSKPFVVTMKNGLTLTVLGTKFNLKAYEQEEKIQAALLEGRVELRNRNNERIVLKPGQIGEYNVLNGKLAFGKGKVSHLSGWVSNKLYMDNMSLSELCRILERKYNVEIVLDDTKLGTQTHYTGVLREESIADVMAAMKQLSGIDYVIRGNRIEIKGTLVKR